MSIEIKQGDATSPRPSNGKGVIIAHLCNNAGAWGAGFVLAVNKLSQIPVHAYHGLSMEYGGGGVGQKTDIPLGTVQMVEVRPDLWVANMVAQQNRVPVADGVKVQYNELRVCLHIVMERAKSLGCVVHIPAGMGAGLAGGDRDTIHAIINEVADKVNLPDPVVLWEFVDTSSPSYIPQTHERKDNH